MKIILASGSPRRKKLLRQLNIAFDVEVSHADESYDDSQNPSGIVRELAMRKALEVAREKTDSLVVGADTIVVHKGRILEKPGDEKHAVSMLRQLSGETHEVLTGVAFVKTDKKGNITRELTFFERTNVTFGTLDEADIVAYVNTGSPLDKAGGYGIQDDWGSVFVKRIEGDYYNVVGFPLYSFYRHAKEWNLQIKPRSPSTDS